MWFGYTAYTAWKAWNKPPIHLQDLDHFPAEAAFVAISGRDISIDHVYLFREQRLRGDTYLRYHFLHREDFEKYKPKIQQIPQEHNYRIVKWESVVDVPETIRAWWVWKVQPDCELSGTMDSYQVYDAANNVVYVYRSGG
jgi:hypothetical protein